MIYLWETNCNFTIQINESRMSTCQPATSSKQHHFIQTFIPMLHRSPKNYSIFFPPVSYCHHKRICRCSVASKADVMVDSMLVTWSAMQPLGRCWDCRHEVELGIACAEVALEISFSFLGWSHCQFHCLSLFVFCVCDMVALHCWKSDALVSINIFLSSLSGIVVESSGFQGYGSCALCFRGSTRSMGNPWAWISSSVIQPISSSRLRILPRTGYIQGD